MLGEINADVQAVIDAEVRTTLRLFNQQLLPEVDAKPFQHVMLVDGNDDRGIAVGLMTRQKFPIALVRSHVDDTDATGTIFSRDCAEFEISLPGNKRLWVMVNHLKSKGYGSQASNDAKRKRQATRIRAIYDAHLAEGETLVTVVGDLNEIAANDALAPLLRHNSIRKDIASHPTYEKRRPRRNPRSLRPLRQAGLHPSLSPTCMTASPQPVSSAAAACEVA